MEHFSVIYAIAILAGCLVALFGAAAIEQYRQPKKTRPTLTKFLADTAGITGSFVALIVAISINEIQVQRVKADEQKFVKQTVDGLKHELMLNASSLSMRLKFQVMLDRKEIDQTTYDRRVIAFLVSRPIYDSVKGRLIELPVDVQKAIVMNEGRFEATLAALQRFDLMPPDERGVALIEARTAAAFYFSALMEATTGKEIPMDKFLEMLDGYADHSTRSHPVKTAPEPQG